MKRIAVAGRWWVLVLVLAGAAACRSATAEAPKSVAVVGVLGGRDQAVDPKLSTSFLALLEVELSGQPNLKLVERQLRDRLLREQQLSLTALSDAQAPLRVGRLLGADLIAWGQPARAGTSPVLLMRVVEVRTGVVRGVSSVPMDAPALVAASGEMAKRVGAIASSDKPPVATVAVGLFENAGRFERLRPLAFLLRDRMTEELERRASLLVVQRTSMQPLIEEMDLLRSGAAPDGATAALPPREATYLVAGSFSDVVGSAPPRVRVRMEMTGAAGGQKLLSEEVECAVADLGPAVAQLAERVDRQTGVPAQPRTGGASPKADEGQALRAQAVKELNRVFGAVPVPTVQSRSAYAQVVGQASYGQPLHVALLRQAIERLEACLFLRPDDLTAKALLASACAVREKETWDGDRAVALYEDVYRADPDGELGLHALEQIPRVHYDAYAQLKYAQHLDRPEHMRACVDGYVRLAEKLAKRDPERSMRAMAEAARWAAEPPLRDVARTLACVRANMAMMAALHLDPSKRPPAAVDGATATLTWVASQNPAAREECRGLLQEWTTHPSPYVRYLSLTALGQLEMRAGNFDLAAERYLAAARVCVGKKDNWFWVREVLAHVGAADAYREGKQYDAGLAVLQSQLDTLSRGQHIEPNVVVAAGKLYESAGRYGQAIELYERFVSVSPYPAPDVVERLKSVRRDHPQGGGTAPTAPAAEYTVHQPDAATFLCAGGGRLWAAAGNRVWSYDPKARQRGPVFAAGTADRDVRALAWAEPFVWVGTRGAGLWRLDTRSDPASWGRADAWKRVEGLPDQNVTALAAGDAGEVYVGVGVPTTGVGGDVTGGVVRVDAGGRVLPLDQPGAPALASDRLVWQQGTLWAMDRTGLRRFDARSSTWSRPFGDRYLQVNGGIDRVLLVSASRSLRTVQWLPADAPPGREVLHDLVARRDLLLGFAVESPDAFWFAGRGPGMAETYELQHMDKRTGAWVPLDGRAGRPFESLRAAVWFQDRLWAATGNGLISVDRVRFPTTAPTR